MLTRSWMSLGYLVREAVLDDLLDVLHDLRHEPADRLGFRDWRLPCIQPLGALFGKNRKAVSGCSVDGTGYARHGEGCAHTA